uniref:Uncharacterized protein n=1 Tax=Arundo donax TaxID=35708 RepID=A0A0A8Y0Y0_ARUDO
MFYVYYIWNPLVPRSRMHKK